MRLHQHLAVAILSFCLVGCAGHSMNTNDDIAKASVTFGGGGRPDAVNWSRSAVYGRNGMAATAHPLASQIAIDILKQGGSAVDGAIAANAALGLMEPTGNGIGGDIFFIIWDPKTEQLYGYNGSGRAPLGRSLAELKSQIAALRESGAMPDGMIAAKAVEALQKFAGTGEPFFMAVGFHKPHLPFVFPEKFLDLYPEDSIQLPTNPYACTVHTHIPAAGPVDQPATGCVSQKTVQMTRMEKCSTKMESIA